MAEIIFNKNKEIYLWILLISGVLALLLYGNITFARTSTGSLDMEPASLAALYIISIIGAGICFILFFIDSEEYKVVGQMYRKSTATQSKEKINWEEVRRF